MGGAESCSYPPVELESDAVKKKLVKRKDLDLDGDQLTELSEHLSNREEMKQRWFKPLLQKTERVVELVQEEAKDFVEGYSNAAEREAARARIAEQLTCDMRMLEVKLLLYRLGDSDDKFTPHVRAAATVCNRYVKEFTFGPFHPALQIGNVILEWNTGSLVIPYYKPAYPEAQTSSGCQCVFAASVHQHMRGEEAVILDKMPLQVGAEQARVVFDRQIQEVSEMCEEQKFRIINIIDVAVKYNTNCHYSLVSCNSQKFVSDALTVLGIANPIEGFTGRLRSHAELLLKHGEKLPMRDFGSHRELDDYVKTQLEQSADEDDIYFCHCHYLLFHAWHQRSPDTPAWQCDPRTCQSEQVEGLLNL